jgi:hypothetical protein
MKLNLILARVFQFVTFVLFTFMVLVYFGLMLVLPLDVVAQIIRILMGIGFPAILAAGVGIGAVAYLGYAVSKMPALYTLVLEIGRDLVDFSYAQIKRFDPLIAEASGETAEQATA